LSDYKNEVTADTTLMQAKQQQLQTEFANMEQTLAKLQSVSSFISAQALALPQTSSSSQSSSA
jgi:flagellar capping protein FliD